MQLGQEFTVEQRLERIELTNRRICWELDCIAHAVKLLLEANHCKKEAAEFIDRFYRERSSMTDVPVSERETEPPPTHPSIE